MKTTLYEIADEYKTFVQMVEDGLIEDAQAIDDTLEGIQQEFDAKLENISCLFKSLTVEADALEAEAKHLQERATYKRRVCDRLKNYVSTQMQSIGQNKLETARVRLSFRKSESVSITDEQTLFNSVREAGMGDLVSVVETLKFDKKGIKQALKDGTALDGAEVITTNNLQIK